MKKLPKMNSIEKINIYKTLLSQIPLFMSVRDINFFDYMYHRSDRTSTTRIERQVLSMFEDYMAERCQEHDGLRKVFANRLFRYNGALYLELLCTAEEYTAFLQSEDCFVPRSSYSPVTSRRLVRARTISDPTSLSSASNDGKPQMVPQMSFPYQEELRNLNANAAMFNANVEDFNDNAYYMAQKLGQVVENRVPDRAIEELGKLNGIADERLKDMNMSFKEIAAALSSVTDAKLPENMSKAFEEISKVSEIVCDDSKMQEKLASIKSALIGNFAPEFAKTTGVTLTVVAVSLLLDWWFNKNHFSLLIGMIILAYLWWVGFLSIDWIKDKFLDLVSRVRNTPQDAMHTDSLLEGLMGMLSLATLGDVYMAKGLSSKLVKLANFSRVASSIEIIFSSVKKVVDYLVNVVRTKILKKDPMLVFSSGFTQFDEFITRFNDLKRRFEDRSFIPSHDNFEHLKYLRIFADHVLLNMPRSQKMIAMSTLVRNAQSFMEKIVSSFLQSGFDKEGMHAEAASVYLHGKPGVGKSIGLFQIAFAVLAQYLDDQDYEDFKRNPYEFMWNCQVENKYCDGVKIRTLLCFWDDIFQFKDKEGNLDGDAPKLIRFQNIFPSMMHMADVSQKGNMFANMLFILATSNIFRAASNLIEDQNALRRRFDFSYEVKPRAEYAKIEETKEGKVVTLDASKLPTRLGITVMDMNVLEFHEYSQVTGKHTGQVYTIHHVIAMLLAKRKTKDERHANQVAVNRDAMTTNRARRDIHRIINRTQKAVRELSQVQDEIKGFVASDSTPDFRELLKPSLFHDGDLLLKQELSKPQMAEPEVEMEDVESSSYASFTEEPVPLPPHVQHVNVNIQGPGVATQEPIAANHIPADWAVAGLHIPENLRSQNPAVPDDFVLNSVFDIWNYDFGPIVSSIIEMSNSNDVVFGRMTQILQHVHARNMWSSGHMVQLILGALARRDQRALIYALAADDDFFFQDYLSSIDKGFLTEAEIYHGLVGFRGTHWFKKMLSISHALTTTLLDLTAAAKRTVDDLGYSWIYEWMGLFSKYKSWIRNLLLILGAIMSPQLMGISIAKALNFFVNAIARIFGYASHHVLGIYNPKNQLKIEKFEEIMVRCKVPEEHWRFYWHMLDQSEELGGLVGSHQNVLKNLAENFSGVDDSVPFKPVHTQVISHDKGPKFSDEIAKQLEKKGAEVENYGPFPTAPSVPQMKDTNDKNCNVVIDNLYRRNCYSIRVDGTNKHLGYGVFIKERYFLMPFHYIRRFNKTFTTEQLKKKNIILRSGEKDLLGGYKEFKVGMYEMCTCYSIEALSGVDACVVFLQSTPKLMRDVSDNFMSETTLANLKNWYSYLMIPDADNQRTLSSEGRLADYPVPVNGGDLGNFTVDRSVQYTMATIEGDCGGLVYIKNPRIVSEKVLGIHTSGWDDGSGGMASVVTQDMLRDCIKGFTPEVLKIIAKNRIDSMKELARISQQAHDDQIPQSIVDQLRSDVKMVPQMAEIREDWRLEKPTADKPFLDKYRIVEILTPALAMASRTAIKKSRLFSLLGPSIKAPAKLKPFVGPTGYIDPFINYLKKMPDVKKMDTRLLNIYRVCAKHYINMVPRDDKIDNVLPLRTSVLGVEGTMLKAIPRSTSIGWPYVYTREYKKGKQDLFGSGMDYNLDNPYYRKWERKMEHDLSQLRSGISPGYRYVDFAKDELRKIERVISGQTRYVSAASVDNIGMAGMLFGKFMIQYGSVPFKMGFLGKVNPYSTDWSEMVHRLASVNSLKAECFGAGDYAGFDTSHTEEILNAIIDAINLWYCPYGDTSCADCIARKVFWKSVTRSVHVHDDMVYEWRQAMPSGNRLTTIINSIVNQVNFRFAWVMLHGGNLEALLTYKENIVAFVMGDDNLFSVSPKCQHTFTEKYLSEVFSLIGYVYTSDDKGKARDRLRALSDVSILKRGVTYHDEAGRWVAPLEIETIYDSLLWSKKGLEYDKITRDKMNKTLRELALHGRHVYTVFSGHLLQAFYEAYREMPECMYEVILSDVLSMQNPWN
jgi:hypothetical protein